MTEIRIICVGKLKETYYQEGIRSFLTFISGKCPISIMECTDEPTPDNASELEENKIRDIEGERILSKIRREDYVTALCIDGTQQSTQNFGRRLRNKLKSLEHSGGAYVFVIGGSLGLSDAVVKRANEKLSFSALTFPHQMMRMILCEQIARVL